MQCQINLNDWISSMCFFNSNCEKLSDTLSIRVRFYFCKSRKGIYEMDIGEMFAYKRDQK